MANKDYKKSYDKGHNRHNNGDTQSWNITDPETIEFIKQIRKEKYKESKGKPDSLSITRDEKLILSYAEAQKRKEGFAERIMKEFSPFGEWSQLKHSVVNFLLLDTPGGDYFIVYSTSIKTEDSSKYIAHLYTSVTEAELAKEKAVAILMKKYNENVYRINHVSKLRDLEEYLIKTFPYE